MATVPFILLSVTAPEVRVDKPAEARSAARSEAAPNQSSGLVPSPVSAEAGATAAPLPKPAPPTPAAGNTAARAPSRSAKNASPFNPTDFQVQCWPAMVVLPGRSATVECSVLLVNGYSGEIGLACRVEGMGCAMAPDRVHAVSGQSAMPARLTVTGPASSEVGTRVVSVTATGRGATAPARTAEVKVNVPPPFSVSCESVGASFVKGEKARLKCWVTFVDGSADGVSLSLKKEDGLPAGLDTTTIPPAPNQTRAFMIELDTSELQSRNYVLHVSASSGRYHQDATAVFSVVPPA